MSKNPKNQQQEKKIDDTELTSKIEENESDVIRIFTLPKKIMQVKILLAIGQIILGITFIVLPALYFANPADESIAMKIFAILALLAGAILIMLFPTNIAKSINSKLILGEKKVSIRNSFGWKEIAWSEVQDILVTEKLSSDPNTNKSIGATLVRFRTISKGYYFYLDSYTVEQIKLLKESLKETFKLAVIGKGYTISEKHERPSVRSRFIFYEKIVDNTTQVVETE
ncbi:MAG: hypothetical protein ACFFDW_04455 [Candidatus Thorarchaeota archaeon]